MDLLIDTTQKGSIILAVLDSGRRELKRREKLGEGVSENLLPEIEKILKSAKVKLGELGRILVNPGPGAFSSLRSGVATANALSLALKIPVASWPGGKISKMVVPVYDKEPHITKPKGKHLTKGVKWIKK